MSVRNMYICYRDLKFRPSIVLCAVIEAYIISQEVKHVEVATSWWYVLILSSIDNLCFEFLSSYLGRNTPFTAIESMLAIAGTFQIGYSLSDFGWHCDLRKNGMLIHLGFNYWLPTLVGLCITTLSLSLQALRPYVNARREAQTNSSSGGEAHSTTIATTSGEPPSLPSANPEIQLTGPPTSMQPSTHLHGAAFSSRLSHLNRIRDSVYREFFRDELRRNLDVEARFTYGEILAKSEAQVTGACHGTTIGGSSNVDPQVHGGGCEIMSSDLSGGIADGGDSSSVGRRVHGNIVGLAGTTTISGFCSTKDPGPSGTK